MSKSRGKVKRSAAQRAIFRRTYSTLAKIISKKIKRTAVLRQRLAHIATTLFGLDLRSLAIMRISLALIILLDLFQRARFLEAHYTDFGILPRTALLQFFTVPATFSFHLMSGMLWFQAMLFILNALFAVLLLLGYRTRLITFICWCFLVSLLNRNTLIIQGGDVLFRVLLFWGIFLPLGKRWSIDELIEKNNEDSPQDDKTNGYFSIASLALLLQVVILYITTAKHKSAPAWHADASAVSLVLRADHFATPFGIWLGQFDELNRFLTKLTLIVEAYVPLLFLLPIFITPARLLAIAVLIAMHIGFAACLRVGLFPLIDIASLLALLPTAFWDRFEQTSIFSKLEEKWTAILRSAQHFKDSLLQALNKDRLLAYGQALTNIAAGFFLVCVVGWVLPYHKIDDFRLPAGLQSVARFFALDQRWRMFSPKPFTDDGWWVIEGRLKDGTVVDVLKKTHGSVDWEKPEDLSDTFVTQRWRKYYRNLLRHERKEIRLHFGKSLCRSWNRGAEPLKQLERFEIFFILERTILGEEPLKTEKLSKWLHFCFEVPEEYKKK